VLFGQLVRSPTGGTIVLNTSSDLQPYDVAGNTFQPEQPEHVFYELLTSVDQAGQHIAVGRDLYDGSATFLRRVRAVGGDTLRSPTALTPDGTTLFQGPERRLAETRVSDGVTLSGTKLGIVPRRIRVAPDGSLLVAYGETPADNRIALIDLTAPTPVTSRHPSVTATFNQRRRQANPTNAGTEDPPRKTRTMKEALRDLVSTISSRSTIRPN
jgi:hypothetical protein